MRVLCLGKNSPDYLQDDVFHGLMSLDGVDVEHNVPFDYLFDDYAGDITELYGRGVSYTRNISSIRKHVVDAYEIFGKLCDHYYDAVIYLSIRRCATYFDDVSRLLSPNHIALIDGEDDIAIFPHAGYRNFKRELTIAPSSDLLPISFAIPESKLCHDMPEKLRLISEEIPRCDRNYAFSREVDYYREYQTSRFAITHKRAGWDCKRHYEILANRCVPIFRDIEACPPYTLMTLLKKMLANIEHSWPSLSDADYREINVALYEYTKAHLTTKHLAQYVLESL